MVLVTPPVSKGGNAGGCFMDQYQQYSAHCETADSGNGSDLESTGVPTKPDDSEESGPSSLGSDSMHGSSTEYVRQAASQPSGQRQRQKSLRVLGALLPDSLLRDIRDRRSTEYVVTFSQTEEEEKIPIPDKIPEKPSPFRLARESLSEEKIEELRAAVERANFVQTGEEPLDSIDATSLSLPASSNIGGHRSNIPLSPSILLFIDYRMLLPKAIRHPPLAKKVGQVGQVPPMMGPIIEILFNNRSGTVGAAGVTANLCSYGSPTSAL